MAKHTPGPWVIYDSSDENHIAIKGFFPRTGGAHVAEVLGSANAHLIAAAPDLLAALKDLLTAVWPHVEDENHEVEYCRAARAAIAKAEP